MTSDKQWKQIHRIADKMAPGLRDEFLAAFKTLAAMLPLNELTELIETESVTDIVAMIRQLELPDPTPITRLLGDAAQQAGNVTATGLDMSFTLDNPAVARWAERHTGELITQITSETRQAVTQIVRDGFIEGIPPRTQARQIRRIVGLTERDAGRVDRFLRGQLDAGIPAKRAETLADRMTAKLLKRRAENIARTEGIRAANRGQYAAWQEAADTGLIDPTRTRVVWIATEDSRTCPICAVLDGKTVGFGEPFVSNVQAVDFTDNGDSFTIHSTKPLKNPIVVLTPPAHPNGRCSLGLVFDETDRRPSAGINAPATTLADVGITPPRDAARRELLEATIARLDGLAPAMRDRYVRLLNDMTDIKINVATSSTTGVKTMGRVTTKYKAGTRELIDMKLMMNISRRTTAYDDWMLLRNSEFKRVGRSGAKIRAWEASNPPPIRWRLATDDELFDVLVHELGHANANSVGVLSVPNEVSREYHKMLYSGNADWRFADIETVKRLVSYQYGTTNGGEMIAELHRFYLNGVSAGTTPLGKVSDVVLSASEWRAQNPLLANFVEGVFAR